MRTRRDREQGVPQSSGALCSVPSLSGEEHAGLDSQEPRERREFRAAHRHKVETPLEVASRRLCLLQRV